MFEKVNPCHPDKVADRIAGAVVDLAYTKSASPKVAVEVLIGHGDCTVIVETSESISPDEVAEMVQRIAGDIYPRAIIVPQDVHLAHNQSKQVRCGDNGIFKGSPVTREQQLLTMLAQDIFEKCPTDGKYIADKERNIFCQSNATKFDLFGCFTGKPITNKTNIINPLGEWTGGVGVDAGATNRKLGSDMGDGVTGGGLHGKDLSKADVSVNIFCHLWAQRTGEVVTAVCAIGDTDVVVRYANKDFSVPFSEIVEVAGDYIRKIGGFEKFAEWGLIR